MTTMTTDPFWIDEHADYDKASDGISRYGAYLRQRVHEFAHCDDAGDFAAQAWKIATGPVMSPGYVRRGWPRIRQVSFGWHEDGLLASAEIDAPLPAGLARLRGYASWEWEDGGWWEPSRFPALLTTVTSLHVIPRDRIPAVEAPNRPHVDTAKVVVTALVVETNRLLRPIMEAIESHG